MDPLLMGVPLRAEKLCCVRPMRPGLAASHIHDVSVAIEPSTFNLFCGADGSGRSLLLRLLALLEVPDAGEVFVDERATCGLDDQARLSMRNEYFGYVFSEPFLLEQFTVLENIAMPYFKLSGGTIEEARAHTSRLLEFAGLLGNEARPISALSLLDQHRASLARALANRPKFLCIEEAQLQLDSGELAQFVQLVHRAGSAFHVTILMSGSQPGLAPEADRVLHLDDGRIVHDSRPVPSEGGAA